MANWVKVAAGCDLAPGNGKAFEIESLSVGVFNVNGSLCAIDNRCPHQGASLADGFLEGDVVTCILHGMKINVIPQPEQTIGMNVRTFPVDLRPDGLYIDVE